MERLWHPGVNLAADSLLFTIDPEQDYRVCALLIERGGTSGAETGRMAFPGGFVNTSAPKGQPFVMDMESTAQAAAREASEETRMLVRPESMTAVGVYDDPKRDPRNEPGVSQVVSHAWAAVVPWSRPKAGDDARRAVWKPLDDLTPDSLAFDHGQMLSDARLALRDELAQLEKLGHSLRVQAHSGARFDASDPAVRIAAEKVFERGARPDESVATDAPASPATLP